HDTVRRETVQQVQFLVEDMGLEGLADQGVTRALIEEGNPGLNDVSVPTFGRGSPRPRWRGGELVAAAMGGARRLTGARGRAPIKQALDACTFHAEMVAAARATAGLYARWGHGLGEHVDVSGRAVAFSRDISGV